MTGPFTNNRATLEQRLIDVHHALVLIHVVMSGRAEDNVFDPAVYAAVARLAYVTAEDCGQLTRALPPEVSEWELPNPDDEDDRKRAFTILRERVVAFKAVGISGGSITDPPEVGRPKRRARTGLCAVQPPAPESAS